MAWNRNDEGMQRNLRQQSSRPRYVRGAFAAAIVIIGCITAWLIISPSESESVKPDEKHPSRIKEAVSAPAPHSKPDADNIKQSAKEEVTVSHPATNQWGNPWHWGNKKLKPKDIIRLDRSKLSLPDQIFPETADRDIAVLLTVEPGTELLGSDEYDETFVKSFKYSLKEPIIITKDDSKEAAELKRAVNEVKIDLKARMDAGEDIAKIMTDTRRELRELGAYREDVKKIIDEVCAKPEMTKEDLHDAVDAANKMLEERGAKKIVLPEFYYERIEYRNKIRKAREANGN